jgi:hypothetical protein
MAPQPVHHTLSSLETSHVQQLATRMSDQGFMYQEAYNANDPYQADGIIAGGEEQYQETWDDDFGDLEFTETNYCDEPEWEEYPETWIPPYTPPAQQQLPGQQVILGMAPSLPFPSAPDLGRDFCQMYPEQCQRGNHQQMIAKPLFRPNMTSGNDTLVEAAETDTSFSHINMPGVGLALLLLVLLLLGLNVGWDKDKDEKSSTTKDSSTTTNPNNPKVTPSEAGRVPGSTPEPKNDATPPKTEVTKANGKNTPAGAGNPVVDAQVGKHNNFLD